MQAKWRSGMLLTLFVVRGGLNSECLMAAELLPMDADGVQRGKIILESFAFRPDRFAVRAGVPVELTLTNEATFVPHNLVVKAPDHGLQVDQDVRAGHTVVLRLYPQKPGTVEFYCDKKLPLFPSHRDKGMVGWLEIR